MTQSAKLNRQITIEKKQTGQDAVFGTETVTWVPLVTSGSPPLAERFWAEVVDALPSRSEAVQQGLVLGRNQTRIRFRWRDDVDSSMRITLHGDMDRVFQIVGGPAEVGGRKEMMEVACERYSS